MFIAQLQHCKDDGLLSNFTVYTCRNSYTRHPFTKSEIVSQLTDIRVADWQVFLFRYDISLMNDS